MSSLDQPQQPDQGFRRGVGGWLVAGLNLLAALNSTWFFVAVMGSGVIGWLMMNSCAPSVFLFVAGFLLASPIVMIAAAVLMFRYGTLGLFFFGWEGTNLFAQAGHVLMTLAVVYVAIDCFRHRRLAALGKGLAIGLLLLVPYMVAQSAWFEAHPDLLEQLFKGFAEAGPRG
jgi:hypothetical protein